MTAPFCIEPLTPAHDRKGFVSEVEALDRYFGAQVSQDVRRRVTACYLALEVATRRIVGYYTLAAGSIPLEEVPDLLARRLPRYPAVPVARLGRLAVRLEARGQRLGAALLWDALLRAGRSELAVFALVVDAKNDQAAAFYRHHGSLAFVSLPHRLVLPLAHRTPA